MSQKQFQVTIPQPDPKLDQHEEWFLVERGGEVRRLRIHDYDELYRTPGLYEEVVYERLGCQSPEVVCGMLSRQMDESAAGLEQPLTVLDFGAGNGMVGELMRERFNCRHVTGVDILPEAREAAYRDRPEVYDEYHVADFTDLEPRVEKALGRRDYNALVTVAALGFGDIGSQAFLRAFNMLDEGAWVAFNIRDKFLDEGDQTGYRDTLEAMWGKSLDLRDRRRYCHRVSTAGQELHYHAVVGRKLRDAPEPQAA